MKMAKQILLKMTNPNVFGIVLICTLCKIAELTNVYHTGLPFSVICITCTH